MKTLIVGGTWNNEGGNSSGLIKKMYEEWIKYNDKEQTTFINGGYYEELDKIMTTAPLYDVILWMAYVPSDLPPKMVKSYNPHALVVGSKRNEDNIPFVNILNKALLKRENMTIEFKRDNSMYSMLVFDPLGTMWYQGNDIKECVANLYRRISFLLTTTRDHVHRVDRPNIPLDNTDFYKYVREISDIFQRTIQHAEGVTRFLGNASFRDKDYIYMSERDVDKTLIDKRHFIATFLKDDKAYYLGEKKPSKDTIVQLKLYSLLKNINLIVHSHCYVKDAPFTKEPVPCGALEEVDEVLAIIDKYYEHNYDLAYYAINLKGHGCLVMGNNLNIMKETHYVTRKLPERIEL